MHRRSFVTLLGTSAAAWPLAARAQQGQRVRWLGVLMGPPEDTSEGRGYSEALEESLQRLGWVAGRNIAIEYRWAANDLTRARSALERVLRLIPDIILVNGGPALMAAQEATRTLPIVFTGVSEPVERGFVVSLAQPGGNTTGFTNLEATMGGKWLELLKEIAPGVQRVGVVFNPQSSFAHAFFRSIEEAAQKLGVLAFAVHVRTPADIDGGVTAIAGEFSGGLLFPPDGFTVAYRQQIHELTLQHRLPSIGSGTSFAKEGGLMSYGTDPKDIFRRAAAYIDRILRGEKPGELPVQQPVKFELVINMKTAKEIGLTVPLTLQVAADEVIE
jgi:putative ABC transport system substrate-binding protein